MLRQLYEDIGWNGMVVGVKDGSGRAVQCVFGTAWIGTGTGTYDLSTYDVHHKLFIIYLSRVLYLSSSRNTDLFFVF
jgi:hypothetical protein